MKKRILYVLALVLMLTLCAVVFVGCGDDADATENGAGDGAGNGSESAAEPTLDDTKFNMFFNDKYLCAFVWGDNSTAAEKAVAKEFRTALGDQTGKQLTFITESKLTDEYKYVILLGKTNQQESKDVYKSLKEREAIAKVVGNKLVIAFDSQSSGEGIVKLLAKELAKSNEGEVRLALNYNAKYKALPEIDALPDYEEGKGEIIDCGEGTAMLYVSGATADYFEEYCANIEEAEFKNVFERTEKGNLFSAFVGENDYIYAYYLKSYNATRIVTGPIEQFAQSDYSISAPETETPYLASIPQPNDGQGYIFQLPDGRFIIQDGGYTGGDRVYQTLKKLKPKGDIVIAAWFISHPHSDHYPAFIDFVKAHGKDKDITLERVIHNYIHADMYNIINGTAGTDYSGKNVEEFYEAAKKYIPNVPIIKAHTGQILHFGSIAIEVLYTPEDMIPAPIKNTNGTSFVFRIVLADGQTFMMLADTYVDSANIMIKVWGDYLRSDIMQMAHHAIWPANSELYHHIQAETILYTAALKNLKRYIFLDPTIRNPITNEVEHQGNEGYIGVNETALNYAKDIYLSIDEMYIFNFPHTLKNNKAEMLEYIKNYK